MDIFNLVLIMSRKIVIPIAQSALIKLSIVYNAKFFIICKQLTQQEFVILAVINVNSA
jgi:hypothetical protein